MKTINEWNDLAEFAGRIVAYDHAGSGYFNAGKGPYKESNIVFAIISETSSNYTPSFVDRNPKGFAAEVLFNKEEIPSTTVFSNGILQKIAGGKKIKMRLATTEELTDLKRIVAEGKAMFTYKDIHKPGFSIGAIDTALALLASKGAPSVGLSLTARL